MRFLVTGGGGFLGGAIVRRLRAEGHQVASFSRGFYPELEELDVDQFQGDLADGDVVLRVVKGYDLVFHVAAKAGIWGDPDDFYRANVEGTQNLLSACRRGGIRRLVYTSSPSVVFNGEDMDGVDESVPYPSRYKAAYPRTKAEAEKMVLAAADVDLATVALRPHLIWGPGDTHLVPGLVARGRTGSLRRIGNEPKLVDFTYIDNAAEAHLCAARALLEDRPISGRVYFISQEEPMPLWDFVNRVLACARVKPVRKSIPFGLAYSAGALLEWIYRTFGWRGEPRLTRFLVEELATSHWFDNGAARRDFGYQPICTMDEGFQRLQASFDNSEPAGEEPR